MEKKMLDMRHVIAVLFAFLATSFLIWGCADPTPSPDDEATSQAASTTEETTSQTTLEEVDQEEAGRHKQLAMGRLSEQAQGVVGDSAVPVLLPDDDQLLRSAHITLGDAWYAASMRGDDHSVAINGTHRTHSAPGAGGKKEGVELRPEGHLLTRSHGIVTLAFEEFGVAYAIDVECENPLENPLCARDEYVISLAEGLGVVGDSQ